MNYKLSVVLATVALLTIAPVAGASDYVHIANAAQLKWQITPANKVYLRNLDEFDSTFLPCCYNYWIDLSTDDGKAFWVALQTKIAAEAEIDLGVASKANPGPLNSIGDYW